MTKEAVSQNYLERVKRVAPRTRPAKRRAIVVGAWPAGNIGSTVASMLFAKGYEVALPTINDLDVTRASSVNEYFRDWRGHDTLVLCNGYTHLDWFEDQPISEMVYQVQVNLLGSMLAAQAFVRATLGEDYLKTIVFMGSMAHKAVLNGSAPYCAAKAGLAHLVECLGWELTPKGYRVFGVHPSNVEGTPMTAKTIEGLARYRQLDQEQAKAYWGAVNLMPTWLRAGDVARTVEHLCSGAADYQSGSNIELKAGQR